MKPRQAITRHVQVKGTQEEEAKALLVRQTETVEKEIVKLKESKDGRAWKVFKIVEAVQGPQKD